MRSKSILLFAVWIFFFACSYTEIKDNLELQRMADQDQADRMSDSDDPVAPKDDKRRQRLFELIAKNRVVTPKDKFNAALILQHTGMIFVGEELKSKSVENYYLAYQYAKSAYESGDEEARNFVAVTYDRYSWMAFGFQKYGTQITYVDGKEFWVKIDARTTDEERAEYNVPPLEELLKQRPML